MTRVSSTCSPLRSGSASSEPGLRGSMRGQRCGAGAGAKHRARTGRALTAAPARSGRGTRPRGVRRPTGSSSGRRPARRTRRSTAASSCGSTGPSTTGTRRGAPRAPAPPAAARAASATRSSPAGAVKRSCPSAPSRVSSAGLPGGDHPAAVDDDDLVGEPLGLVHEVRGEHDGDAVGAQLRGPVPGRVPGLRVQPGGRLVEEDQLGPADHGQRQRQPLLLRRRTAAGTRVRPRRAQAQPLAAARPGPAGGRVQRAE